MSRHVAAIDPRAASPRCIAVDPAGAIGVAAAFLVLAGAAAAQAAPFGLVCHLTQRAHHTCNQGQCVASDVRAWDETRRYIVDPDARSIIAYGPDGATLGSAFHQPMRLEDGVLTATGGGLGMGVSELTAITVRVAARTGGLDVYIAPGGEFGGGDDDYNLDGQCLGADPATIARPIG